MVGPTAQVASLALHLNARLRSISVPPFQNSTTQYCEVIRFLHKAEPPDPSAPDPNWRIIADDPDAWLASLRGVSRALLVHEPSNDPRLSDRMSSGFVGGGGRWFLCLDRGGSFECWEAWWKVGNQNAVDRRIWHVHYARVVDDHVIERQELARACQPVAEVRDRLGAALTRIESFARSRALEGFADSFRRALTCLDSPDPLSLVFHKDIAPAGVLALEAAQVLSACQAAWVFGGMGSWNDMSFQGDDGKVYESISDELFDLINRAICAGTNHAAPRVLRCD
jgi:hypothetical protein